ncbi:TetR/AcrR family transcriptional regulator [Thalassotalea crassostreae]|uniref:TetR/AcrR family transcriptional regulator n=1 Tax=Thalassotalea crassostreae TaxID=1763536 RepID=UPI0008398381|nr:TetR/AcrR family transcriptional regulator [Thalassotalea crassostreae]
MPANKKNKISSPFSKTNQHDNKYKTILSAASELFNIYGTRGTTLTQIADKLKLTKTSLYYYVKTKEELVHQCYLNTCIEMQSMVESALALEGSALDKLEKLIRLNFDCWNDIVDGNRGHLAGLTEIASLSENHQKEISEYYRHFVIQVINIIEEGQTDGSMQNVSQVKTSNAIWGTIFWLPIWLNAVKPEAREEAFNQLISVIRYGLNNQSQQFEFQPFAHEQIQTAPEGFNRQQQNRKKQEAFFRVGSIFFNQKGFKGTSLDELASSLGVTKGAFYYHIKNKDDLLVKCFERTLNIENKVLEESLKISSTGINKLAFAAQKLFNIQVGDQGPLIRYATMWSFDLERRKQIEQAFKETRVIFGKVIQLGIDDKSIKNVDRMVAENIIAGAIEAIPDMASAMSKDELKDSSNEYFHIFFNGIATQ